MMSWLGSSERLVYLCADGGNECTQDITACMAPRAHSSSAAGREEAPSFSADCSEKLWAPATCRLDLDGPCRAGARRHTIDSPPEVCCVCAARQ